MKNHTKVYFDFFNIDYDIATGYHDYIDCEVDQKEVIDVHHIIFKSQGGKDNIENLIGLCRECHDKAHDGTLKQDDLQRIHDFHVLKNC
jgi:HNH endonuclease